VRFTHNARGAVARAVTARAVQPVTDAQERRRGAPAAAAAALNKELACKWSLRDRVNQRDVRPSNHTLA
jgi:hypothetical protein